MFKVANNQITNALKPYFPINIGSHNYRLYKASIQYTYIYNTGELQRHPNK